MGIDALLDQLEVTDDERAAVEATATPSQPYSTGSPTSPRTDTEATRHRAGLHPARPAPLRPGRTIGRRGARL
jgi:hypothetical protein